MGEKLYPEADATAEFMVRVTSDLLQNAGLAEEVVASIVAKLVSASQMPEMLTVDKESREELSEHFPAVFSMTPDRLELARQGLSDSYGTCFIAGGLSFRNHSN